MTAPQDMPPLPPSVAGLTNGYGKLTMQAYARAHAAALQDRVDVLEAENALLRQASSSQYADTNFSAG